MFIHSQAEQEKSVWLLGDRYTMRVRSDDTAGAYAMFEQCCYPGNGTPPHVHHGENETFYILEGELTFYLGESRERRVAKAGDVLHAPKGVPHFYRNKGGVPTRLLVTVTPGGFEKFFEEIGSRAQPTSAEPPPVGPEELGKVLEAAPRYNLEVLGPPPWIQG